MMKKQYITPAILNKETIENDQAIAACTVGTGYFQAEFLGYHDIWNRSYASVAGGNGTVYETIAEAQKAAYSNDAPIGAVYSIWYVNGSEKVWVCYYEDLNADGNLDRENGDNLQTVVRHYEIYNGYYQS